MLFDGDTLADEIGIYLLDDCGVVGADIEAPFRIASVGAAIANLRQKVKPEDAQRIFPQGKHTFFTPGRVPLDLRLNLLTVAPPGGGKSLYLDYFLDPVVGFLAETPFKCLRFTKLTSAGFIGSFYQGNKGIPVLVPGDAQKYPNAIMGLDEISGMLRVRQDYDADLLDTLLQVLDRGEVHKRTAMGEIQFQTYLTVWGGSQPSPTEDRVNLTYGMGRRFLIMRVGRTKEEDMRVVENRRKHSVAEPNQSLLGLIRKQIKDLYEECRIENMTFSDDYQEFKSKLGLRSVDDEMVDRLAIGWAVMSDYDGEDSLYVGLDPRLREMILLALNWKYANLIWGHKVDVFRILKPDTPYTNKALRFELACSLGFTLRELDLVIDRLKKDGVLKARDYYSQTGEIEWYVDISNELYREIRGGEFFGNND